MAMRARMEETIKVVERCSEAMFSSVAMRAVMNDAEPAPPTTARTTAKGGSAASMGSWNRLRVTPKPC